MDSFDIIQVMMKLNEGFDIGIQVEDLLPKHFNDIEAMLELITKLQNK